MTFDFIDTYWLENASEDEMRSVASEIQAELDRLDYDSDEHTRLSNISVDVVNAISSRFPLNLTKSEHGWYLPNDDD